LQLRKLQTIAIHGRLFRLHSNPNARRGSRKNDLYDGRGQLQVQCNAIRPLKCRCYILADEEKSFKEEIGEMLEAYMDDMIAKSAVKNKHKAHLSVVFNKLRKFNMRLNPEKCTFGVKV
jgi:hypothetical protein